MALFDIKLSNYKLSLEELDEYKEACEQGDIVETYFQSYLLACEEFKKLK